MPDYTDELNYDKYILPAGIQSLPIQAGGYLTAIMVTKLLFPSPGWTAEELHFELVSHVELVSHDHNDKYVEFAIPIELTTGGKWFEPIPNLSAAWPYFLISKERTPQLEVISVNRNQGR